MVELGPQTCLSLLILLCTEVTEQPRSMVCPAISFPWQLLDFVLWARGDLAEAQWTSSQDPLTSLWPRTSPQGISWHPLPLGSLLKISLETAPPLWTLIPGTLDTGKFPKGQEAGEQVSEICRRVGQCILGLQVRLVSAPPRQRGQPAGLGRGWIHRGPDWAGWPGWGRLLWEEKDNSEASEWGLLSAGRAGQLLPSACPVTLGEPLLSVNSGFALARSEEIQGHL